MSPQPSLAMTRKRRRVVSKTDPHLQTYMWIIRDLVPFEDAAEEATVEDAVRDLKRHQDAVGKAPKPYDPKDPKQHSQLLQPRRRVFLLGV